MMVFAGGDHGCQFFCKKQNSMRPDMMMALDFKGLVLDVKH